MFKHYSETRPSLRYALILIMLVNSFLNEINFLSFQIPQSHILKMQNNCVNVLRYIMLLVLFISMAAALLVLGVDLDWLINGPQFVAKVCARIQER